ncbi:ATP-binding cassette domain-containing protein [Streptomyces katrae]|uniref:ATP-binding cassette domain-containing protein n=1 Tax=Streptomyces katrae TaxID=68223 RepID=A0ABT7GXG8_9ACTN|nr:ATP-binding cassette domain-containing protein [Streptomyces katrae]MDK9497599.1 ATP-binding cassette domain-containing protein [Streptomyces katrae]
MLAEVGKRYGTRTVLDRVGFSVRPGERVGVVGDNGSGKSTLLRLLAGQERADAGEVCVRAPGGVGYLAQTLDLPAGARVGDAVDRALAGLRELERRIRAAEERLHLAGPEQVEAYGRLVAEYDARGGRDADRRVAAILRRLGEREPIERGRVLGTLSGGQRSRLALAAALAAEPELLLLDEPTNDLDDEAVGWLEEHLLRRTGTLVAVTHDRMFLDRVTTAVLEVDHDRLAVHRHGNGYAGHLVARAAARARWEREYEEWVEETRRVERLAEGNIGRLARIPRKAPAAFSGAGAFRARSRAHGAMSRIRNARERLARLTEHPVPAPPQPLRFTGRFGADDGPGGGVDVRRVDVRGMDVRGMDVRGMDVRGVDVRGLAVRGLAVPGRLAAVSFRLEAGERMLVTGPNGSGKSTLLQVLAGLVPPGDGSVRAPGRVGLLPQDDPWSGEGRSAAGAFGEEVAEALGRFGLLGAADAERPLRELSAGQRRKVELGRLVADGPYDLLLLDEPTNHLAPGVVEDLEAALAPYAGTLIVVSHDRRLRAGFSGKRLALGGAGVPDASRPAADAAADAAAHAAAHAAGVPAGR